MSDLKIGNEVIRHCAFCGTPQNFVVKRFDPDGVPQGTSSHGCKGVVGFIRTVEQCLDVDYPPDGGEPLDRGASREIETEDGSLIIEGKITRQVQ